MGCEEKSGLAAAKDFSFQEAAKLGGTDGIQAARRLIQQENPRLVNESASEAQTLHGTGRERTNLAVEDFFEMKLSASCAMRLAEAAPEAG